MSKTIKMDQTENTVPATEEQTSKVDQARVDSLTKEHEALLASFKNKVYPVKLETDGVLAALIDFIENHATWKNMEALGIIEVSKALKECKSAGLNSGNIFLASLPIQAISFFLSKVEDAGLTKAERHIKLVKPIDDALRLIKQDNDAQNALESKLAAAENGISIESTPEK